MHSWVKGSAPVTIALALCLPGCGRESVPRLPLPPPGWHLVEGPTEYRPDSLWEYLDGAAPHYVAYGFRRLAHGRYESERSPQSAVTLDVYDMGSELGAFGIYSRGRLPRDPARDWGVEGYRTAGVAAAWKGRTYIHAEADDERPETIALMENLVAAACEAASGTLAPPAILEALPVEGRVSRSERYVAEKLLGHAFLPGGVSATYRAADGEAELFFSNLESPTAAREAIAHLRDHESARGARVEELPGLGTRGFSCEDPGLGNLAAATVGPYVAGVHGDPPRESLQPILERLLTRLQDLP